MSVQGDEFTEEQHTDLTPIQKLEESVENLSEKRGSTREAALDTIIKELRANYQSEFVESNKVTLLEAIKRGLKKGSSKEQQLSAQALSLLVITIGAGSEEIYKDVSPLLEEIINNPSVQEEVRAAVIDAYAMLCFIGNPDEVVTVSSMQVLKKVWHDTHQNKPLVLTSALRGWGLLATTVSQKYIYDYIIIEDLASIVDHLSNENVDVRVAAGEDIALMFEVGRETEEDTFDLYNFSHHASIDIDHLLDTLYELSADKTKQRAKKDKLKQKTPFKEVTSFVEEGRRPSETLSFKHQSFTFDSWVMLIQLDALRDVLAEGLKSHFEENDLLTQIFGMVLDKEQKKLQLSQVEKRFYLSTNSPQAKARSKNLTKQRSQKTTQLNLESD